MYLYDLKGDIVFKIPSTRVGLKTVHSMEALDGNKKDSSNIQEENLVQAECNLVTMGNTTCYEPNINGFAKEKTSVLYYKTNADGTVDVTPEIVSVEEYLQNKDRVITKQDGSSYEFYNYKKIAETNPTYNSIWANIKIEGGGIETNWVWVPRYAYKVNGNNILIEYIDVNDNVAGTNKKIGDPEDEDYKDYIVHSEFLGNTKKGIWISKYEVEQVANQETADYPYYIPDLKGFNKDTTFVEIYKDDGTFDEVKLSEIGNIKDFIKNNRWFDYHNKIWANIKTVSSGGAESWWVWVPRYAYSISGNVTGIVFTDLENRPLDGSTLSSNYVPHSAFGNDKKGIWVSKYEVSQEAVDIPTTNNVNFPELNGFNPENTYIELYKDDGTFEEVKLSTINNIEEYATQHRWYDYSKQIWANIKVINTQGNTNSNDDVETWWVWVPRYAYDITSNLTHVIFLDKDGNPRDGNTLPGNYVPHSAFEGKSGIWVSKYEVSNVN